MNHHAVDVAALDEAPKFRWNNRKRQPRSGALQVQRYCRLTRDVDRGRRCLEPYGHKGVFHPMDTGTLHLELHPAREELYPAPAESSASQQVATARFEEVHLG